MSDLALDVVEARVLGVLMEKEITTPDAYPLSLNGATTGCNQKSNRDPVTQYTEGQVRDALERLVDRTLVREAGSSGGRARRFAHRLDSRLFGTLEFSREERAVLCILLLRGAQTPGEIRSRTARLVDFPSLEAVQAVLDALHTREDGPFAEALAREPGRREVRYRELLQRHREAPPAEDDAGMAAMPDAPATVPPPGEQTFAAPDRPSSSLEQRLAAAEARILALEEAVATLRGAAPLEDPELD